MQNIYDELGSHQVTRRKLSFSPPWILDKAFHKEYYYNWHDAYESKQGREILPYANIVASHVIYKVKTDEEGVRTLKARIVPHGNRDNEKDNARKDSASTQLNVICLVLSISIILGFKLATTDIKGAYLQSGPIRRIIYVRPSVEWYSTPAYTRGILWKLTNPLTALLKL